MMKLHVLLALSFGSVACSADRAPVPVAMTIATALPTTTPSVVLSALPVADGGDLFDAGEPQTGDLGLTGYGQTGGTGIGPSIVDSAGHRSGVSALQVRTGAVSIRGRIPREIVERVVRKQYGWFRFCYEQARSRSPSVQGRVQVRFAIGDDGVVTTAAIDTALTDVPDAAMLACVLKGFAKLAFPHPEGGVALVGLPLTFAPPLPAPAVPVPSPTP